MRWTDNSWFSERRALAIFRVVVSILLLQHGLQIVTGYPPHPGGPRYALASLVGVGGMIQLIGGLLVIAGTYARQAAFILAGEMAVIYFGWHAPQSLFPINNGGDAPILYCFSYLLILFAGPGRLRAPSQG